MTTQVYESASRGDNGSLVEELVELLGSGRAGLMTDVDGTISPIVALPEAARVLPRAAAALTQLRDVLALVAVVSGRRVLDTLAMVGVQGLTYIGNHGYEFLGPHGPEVVPAAQDWVPRVTAALEAVQNLLQRDDVLVENKGATASFHYRLALDPDRVRQDLLEIVGNVASTSGLRLEEGRKVINLLPPLSISKGSAVSWLAGEHRLERLVYFGDDETDAHALTAVRLLRQSGEVRTLGIAVVDAETPASVRRLADATVASPEAVADLLCGVAERLPVEC